MAFTPKGTAYQRHGQANGESLLLIHGIGLHKGLWRDYLAPLSTHYDVISYDLWGHGDSAKAPSQASLTLYTQQIKELLEHLSITRVALIGFSLGGMINRHFTQQHADQVSALIILNSPHRRSAEAQALVEKRANDLDSGSPSASLQSTLARWFTPRFLDQHPERAAQVAHWVLGNDTEQFLAARRVLAYGVKELLHPKPAIDIASLVITCENDSGSTPAMSAAIAAEIPNANLQIIDELQHMGLFEHPSAFVDPIKDFLERSLQQAPANP